MVIRASKDKEDNYHKINITGGVPITLSTKQ